MKNSVRQVNLESESGELLSILDACLPFISHQRRFPWLYRANPDGPAWSWFVCDAASGRPVGVASVFPRRMWVGGRLQLCGQVGDFAIAPSHRSLGPALLLQRATFQPVDRRCLSFCYDCPPHAAGMSTFRRLGVEPSTSVARYVLPLRLDPHIRKRLGFVPPVVTPALNLLLRAWRGRTARLAGLEIAEHAGPFDDEFTSHDTAPPDVIRGSRSADSLNWRYRQDPLNEYRVLTARRRGELAAFLVFTIRGETIRLVDLSGRDLDAAAPALVDALASRSRAACDRIEACLSEGSDLVAPLVRAGFRLRSVAAQVVAYASPGSETSRYLDGHPRWAFHTAEVLA